MLSTCMGYVGFIFGVVCCSDGMVDLSSLLHARPMAAMMAAMAIHAIMMTSQPYHQNNKQPQI